MTQVNPETFEKLYEKGEYKELLELAKTDLDKDYCKYWQVTALWRLGHLDKAFDLATKYEDQLNEMQMKWRGKHLNRIGTLYWSKGDLDLAQEYIERSLKIYKKLGNKNFIAEALNGLGIINHDKADLNTAIEYYKKSLNLYKELDSNQDIAGLLMNLGNIQNHKGNLDQALKHYKNALNLFKNIGNNQDIASALVNIGTIHFKKGELDKALNNYNRAQKLEEDIGNDSHIAANFLNIGDIYFDRGELEKAINYYERSFKLYKDIGNPKDISIGILNLVNAYTRDKQRDKAFAKLEILSQLTEAEDDNKVVNLMYKYSKAVYLKSSKRLKDKIHAQELFEEIIEVNDFNFELLIDSLYHLIDLLINEYKMYEESEVLFQIIRYTNQIQEIANEQNLFSTVVNVQILKSRLALVQTEFDMAKQHLSEALEVAEEKNMQQSIARVNKEKEKLDKKLNQIEQQIKQEDIPKSGEKQLRDYIKTSGEYKIEEWNLQDYIEPFQKLDDNDQE